MSILGKVLVIFSLSFSPSIPENPSNKLPIKLFLTTSCHTFPDLASVCEVTFKGSKETGQWRKIEKNDMVSFLHSFFVIAPRIITIDDPSFMLCEKISIPKLHMDTLQFQPGWQDSDREWMLDEMKNFSPSMKLGSSMEIILVFL